MWINNQEATKEDFKVIRPGLNGGAGTLSFESISTPSHYAVHRNNLINNEEFSDDSDFAGRASWIDKDDHFYPGYTAFESVDSPGKSISRTIQLTNYLDFP